jgi:hypothetical protein
MFKYDTDILELLYSKTKYIMAIPGKVTKGGGLFQEKLQGG